MSPVSRASLKLAAAIDHFRLASRIRSASAIDIGASTGGFTERMLEHGARHVVAVDVGHGQLHPSLAADPRVESMEGVHFKTLALDVAPGPFDFFTVDVSFIAARTMLRGLAFRLRPGAEGVVLIKPQFELPDKQVRDGDVSDPALRKRAIERVREKAEALGFEIAGVIDSPVPGESGTVEMLAHLKFHGRSDKLPAPGERRASAEPARSTASLSEDYFAVAAPGLEDAVYREVAALAEVRDVRTVEGGVAFAGPLAVLYRANLQLRIATRVLVRVGELEAREFGKLRRRGAKIPWQLYFAPGQAVDVSASASGCRLYHTGAIDENVTAAIADRVGKPKGEAALKVLVRGVRDQFTFSVDSSGELLHRRGYRTEQAMAPMRETLAAGLLALAGWSPDEPLVDPMCGSGTLPIEACLAAMHIAPGIKRSFAFERWPSFDAALLAKVRTELEARAIDRPPAPIVAADASARAVAVTRANVERAGLTAAIRVEHARARDLEPPAPTGLLVANPPYGERMGSTSAVRAVYGELGRMLRDRFRGYRAAILVPPGQGALAKSALGPTTNCFSIRNGGIRLQLWCLPAKGRAMV